MPLRCLCGKENTSESQYCGDCGRLLSEVEVDPELQAKIRSVVANQLNRRSKDKNSVELEIAANAFEMARRWLIASFAVVGLVLLYFGWSFNSFVEGTKKTISEHQGEIEQYKNAVESEKEKLLGKIEQLNIEIDSLSKKIKQENLDVFVEQIGVLRSEIGGTAHRVVRLEAKISGLESAISHSLMTGIPVNKEEQDKVITQFKKYNHFLYELGLSFAENIDVEVQETIPLNRPDFLEKFIEIEKDIGKVKVASFIYELIDPVINDFTKCNLMELLKLTDNARVVIGNIQPGYLEEKFNTIAALAAYYTCSFLDSPIIHLGKNTNLQIDQLPVNLGTSQIGLFNSKVRILSYSLWKLREEIGGDATDRIIANALTQLSRKGETPQLDTAFLFAQLFTSAQEYEGGKYLENVRRLIKTSAKTTDQPEQ